MDFPPKGPLHAPPHSALPRSHSRAERDRHADRRARRVTAGAVIKCPAAADPAPARIPGSLALASSDHVTPHGQAGGGSRLPTVPLRFTAARLAVLPRRRCSAPRSPASGFLVARPRPAHPMPPAPRKNPPRCAGNCASGTSLVSSASEARAATSGRYGVKRCRCLSILRQSVRPSPLRSGCHSRRFRAPSSLVQLGRSCGIA